MYLLKKVFELREKAHSDHEKPFLEHLEDLRVLITRVVITLLISMIFSFLFREQLMDILRAPAENVVFVKQQETMPDAKKFENILVPSVEQWNEAKEIEAVISGLGAKEKAVFFEQLGNQELEYHASSISLLRAANALPKETRANFIESLDLDTRMNQQMLALLDSDPDVALSSGANIRMMSALKPTETFMLSMKLAFFAGIVLAFPLLLMFLLQFVLPGLHQAERKILWPAMAIGFGLFVSGVLFAYFFVLPRALLFFYEWSSDLGVSNDWRIGEYINFATQFTLLFGLSFELPVIVMVLVKLGLLTYDTMSRTRTYAIVAIYIAAAVITPTPDIMTLNLMALPMLFLYELCIWLAYFDRKKERQREAEEEEEMRKRRLEWIENHHEREEAAEAGEGFIKDGVRYDKHGHPIDEDGGWDESFEHNTDHEEDDLETNEPWTQPDDAVVGSSDSDHPASTKNAQVPEDDDKSLDEGTAERTDEGADEKR